MEKSFATVLFSRTASTLPHLPSCTQRHKVQEEEGLWLCKYSWHHPKVSVIGYLIVYKKYHPTSAFIA